MIASLVTSPWSLISPPDPSRLLMTRPLSAYGVPGAFSLNVRHFRGLQRAVSAQPTELVRRVADLPRVVARRAAT